MSLVLAVVGSNHLALQRPRVVPLGPAGVDGGGRTMDVFGLQQQNGEITKINPENQNLVWIRSIGASGWILL